MKSAEPLTENFAYDPVIKGEGFLIQPNESENEAFKHIIIVHD